MRYRLIQLIVLLFISVGTFAQRNGSFEAYNGTDPEKAFSDGTVPDWKQSHGTPTITGGAPGQGAFSALMWSHSGRGEGIVQNFLFEAGETYQLTFWVRTKNPNGNFFVKAANNVPAGTTTGESLPNVSSQQSIFTGGMNYSTWQQVTTTFVAHTNYSQLWIYAYLNSPPRNGQAEVSIDGIQVLKKTCEFVDKNITNNGFENVTGTPLSNAFALGHVTDWQQSHGTPEIRQGVSSHGNYSAWISANNRFTEGIVRRVAFTAGRTYRISFWVKGNTQHSSQIILKAAHSVPSSTFPLIPSAGGEQILFSKSANFDQWTLQTVTFTPNIHYSQLWFYAIMGHTSNLEVGIDQVVVEEEVCTFTNPIIRTTRQEVVIEEIPQVLNANIYPNPTAKTIKVALPSATKQVNISLFNASTGKRVAGFTMNRSQSEWVIPENIKDGVYLVVMTDPASNITKTTRLVIKRK
ncbi:hypothetical protein BKI52_04835 [marine bacterium AO1-C]|nr:hypothetical protein BKI52_04835 [marine bacterium AO1-C]